jgi:hypothetical protein
MGCIGGTDDANGSTPRVAETVITEINEPIRKKARVSVSGVSFIVCYKKRFTSSELSMTSYQQLGRSSMN